jgi:hypothetical protein
MDKALHRRVCKLEALLKPANQTAFSRQLLRRLESGSRRAAEMRERDGLCPMEDWPPDGRGRPVTLVEILHRGRTQNALAHQALVIQNPETSLGTAREEGKANPAE